MSTPVLAPALKFPQNDAQLNANIAQMNAAYTKYFDVYIGPKRSEKLRDCYCEGILGLTNGAYQQLQAAWAQQAEYDLSTPDKHNTLLYNDNLGGIVATFATPFLAKLLPTLERLYPMVNGQFCSSSNPINAGQKANKQGFECSGWFTLTHASAADPKTPMAGNEYLPLYFGVIQVGFGFDRNTTILLNGILAFLAYTQPGMIKSFVTCLSHETQSTYGDYLHPSKVVALQMDAFEGEIWLPFDLVEMTNTVTTVHQGGNKIQFNYDRGTECATLGDWRFDAFLCIYKGTDRYGLEVDKGVSLPDNQVEITLRDDDPLYTRVEWHGSDPIELFKSRDAMEYHGNGRFLPAAHIH